MLSLVPGLGLGVRFLEKSHVPSPRTDGARACRGVGRHVPGSGSRSRICSTTRRWWGFKKLSILTSQVGLRSALPQRFGLVCALLQASGRPEGTKDVCPWPLFWALGHSLCPILSSPPSSSGLSLCL